MDLIVESLDGIPRREKYRIVREVNSPSDE